ncbi:MAG: AraC family ligand binding domain-containing protein [Clostridia bacterium]|nr:AraC family ligand binding domain-containing protein [Clostridia bacterium]
MATHSVWDRSNQMPPGREFEAYHFVDTNAQPVYYHSHPHYEIYFFVQGHSRIIVEGLDIQPVKGDVLIFPPGIMHRNIHVDAEIPYERFYYFARREFLQSVSAADYDIPGTLEKMTRNDHYFYHVEERELEELIALTDWVIDASERTHPADKLMNRNRFTILLLEALTMMSSREVTPQSDYSKGMSDLIRYINLHATEPLSLDDLAGAFYASKYEILREFKKKHRHFHPSIPDHAPHPHRSGIDPAGRQAQGRQPPVRLFRLFQLLPGLQNAGGRFAGTVSRRAK